MNMRKPLLRLKSPCARCPYKLGLIRAIVNPCPQCRTNGYSLFEQLKKQHFPLTSREKGRFLWKF